MAHIGDAVYCSIRKQPETRKGGRKGGSALRLSVDHDHKTSLVRGLLCTQCNQAIGAFEESPERMTAAMAYLQRSLAAMKLKQLTLFEQRGEYLAS